MVMSRPAETAGALAAADEGQGRSRFLAASAKMRADGARRRAAGPAAWRRVRAEAELAERSWTLLPDLARTRLERLRLLVLLILFSSEEDREESSSSMAALLLRSAAAGDADAHAAVHHWDPSAKLPPFLTDSKRERSEN
ncbi:uncharacterized protein A4U43_C09F16910 [Asparagus officinalis]|uniref:Uncharacterized protein n=1 Tax=Asparagus officinalis TaxID=4686 RepID=A0A5P1E801_ASPOF|nr:uncharacterized protein A4U43_C09F16910 [Asparagus officinalis]